MCPVTRKTGNNILLLGNSATGFHVILAEDEDFVLAHVV